MMFKFYFALTLLMSLVTFVAYGWDKRQAVAGNDRLSESSLHLLALFCGWPGALVGQRFFRHKTVKLSFRFVLWAIVSLHLLLFGWLMLRQ